MWTLFQQIARFWECAEDVQTYRSRFIGFMLDRIQLNPLYREYYATASAAIEKLVEQHGGEDDSAYEFLFTDPAINQPPPETALELARQRVSNEFVAVYLALGGFKTFGARNYPGYFGGPNVPGEPAPYRTSHE
jgi:hypothetical protein